MFSVSDNRAIVKELGQAVSFVLSNNSVLNTDADGNPLFGIFDEDFINPRLGEINLDTNSPVVTCLTVDITGVKKGNVATINNKNYDVAHIQNDGAGMTAVVLSNDYS